MAEAADIVIVGAGATGLAFAWRLANLQPNLRILLVERGDFVNQRNAASKKNDWELALQKSFHANPNIRKSAADYPVDESQTPIKPAFFNAVGGSTIRWGAHFPRFRPSDFCSFSQDDIAADWPLNYYDLAPYMDINDEMMGVSGLAGDPANPVRAERGHPPLGFCTGSRKLAEAANKLGWHWWPADAAIASTDSAVGRGACNNCGPCGIGCPRHARASADIAYLRAAQQVGVNLITCKIVKQIITINGEIKAVEIINQNGTIMKINCGELVLAGNALSTNILLRSIDGWHNQLLGQGLMLHPTAIVTGYFKEDLQSYAGPFATSIVSQQFCETDQARGFLRGFQMQVLRSQGPLSTALGGYGKRLPWGAQHNRDFDSAFGQSISLTITCEDLPEAENRIEVDKSRLDKFGMPTARMIYRLGENSLKMRDFGIARAREWLVAAGAQKIAVTPLSEQAGFHLMGTAQMGSCAKKSVTRNDGRVHGFENLTIIDASVFVTSSPVNPTSTLQSLALRAADLMSARLAAA